ncbi:MAG: NrpR regulatory domain-containing protein [Spirochaetota bacterium]|nr:NrpR regulatory domain-containing protein [Spirochaetota bacterium]
MSKSSEQKIINILKILQNNNKPACSIIISRQMLELGFDLSERTIRYYLQKMDYQGLTENLGKRGRIITPKGINELKSAFVFEKVGFIASKIDFLTYQMDFSLQKLKGTIIINLTTFNKQFFNKAFKQIESVFQAGLGMGKFLTISHPGDTIGNIIIDEDRVAIGTVCSVTINGIFLKEGINISSRFGGVLEISKGHPLRFTDIINYNGTSIDPLEIFIKGGMTSIREIISTGSGKIGASFREFPSIAMPKVEKIKKRLDDIGLGGILLIGKPGQPLLDIPVPDGRVGMIVAGGLNPIAAVEESGIPTENEALKTIYDFNEMKLYTKVDLFNTPFRMIRRD